MGIADGIAVLRPGCSLGSRCCRTTLACILCASPSSEISMTTAAAYIFAVLAISVASFQVALAGGMPWGRLTWGGKFSGTLPGYMRAFAVISAALLLAFTLVVVVRAGVVFPEW